MTILQLGLPVAFVFVGWKWVRYEGKGIEDVTSYDLNCPELNASAVSAHQSMPLFLIEVAKGIDGAFVKFPLKTPKGLMEHIWAYVHSFRDGKFNVSLACVPYDDTTEAEGRRDVPIEEVEDWQIMQTNGTIRGAYSLRALFAYRERVGKFISPKMKKQKAQLAPVEPPL